MQLWTFDITKEHPSTYYATDDDYGCDFSAAFSQHPSDGFSTCHEKPLQKDHDHKQLFHTQFYREIRQVLFSHVDYTITETGSADTYIKSYGLHYHRDWISGHIH